MNTSVVPTIVGMLFASRRTVARKRLYLAESLNATIRIASIESALWVQQINNWSLSTTSRKLEISFLFLIRLNKA